MNNNPSDQETSETIKKINDIFHRFVPTFHKNGAITLGEDRRVYLFNRLLNGWNKERKIAGFKEISPKRLAVAINSNPFLKKDDGEFELLIKECEEKGSYKKAQWVLFPRLNKAR